MLINHTDAKEHTHTACQTTNKTLVFLENHGENPAFNVVYVCMWCVFNTHRV